MRTVVVVTLAFSFACVVFEPAPELAIPAPRRPTIIADAVSPSPALPVSNLQNIQDFSVPVEVDQAFAWRVFIDSAKVADGGDNIAPANNIVHFNLGDPNIVDPNICHLITFIVTYQVIISNQRAALGNNGDSISWTYRPGGNAAPCILSDAGIADAASTADGGSADAMDEGAE